MARANTGVSSHRRRLSPAPLSRSPASPAPAAPTPASPSQALESGASSSAVVATPSGNDWARLPAELRNKIYIEALTSTYPINPLINSFRKKKIRADNDYAPPQFSPIILALNKTIYKEAIGYLYACNTFDFTVDEHTCCPLRGLRCVHGDMRNEIDDWFRTIGLTNAAFIRSVSMMPTEVAGQANSRGTSAFAERIPEFWSTEAHLEVFERALRVNAANIQEIVFPNRLLTKIFYDGIWLWGQNSSRKAGVMTGVAPPPSKYADFQLRHLWSYYRRLFPRLQKLLINPSSESYHPKEDMMKLMEQNSWGFSKFLAGPDLSEGYEVKRDMSWKVYRESEWIRVSSQEVEEDMRSESDPEKAMNPW